MKKLVIAVLVALLLGAAGFGAYSLVDDDRTAEAINGIDCSLETDTSTDPDTMTVTCGGTITVNIPPFGGQTITFELVVVAADNPPPGPSFGDEILSCTLDIGDGSGPQPISFGPCP